MLKTRVLIGTATLAAAFLFADGRSLYAQTTEKDAPSVEELREKVKQLEKTVEELKTQIGSIEDAQKKAESGTISTASPKVIQAVSDKPLTTASVPERPSSGAAAESPVKRDTKGENTFEVYGFAMLDAGYDFKSNDPNWFDTVRPTKLPSFGG